MPDGQAHFVIYRDAIGEWRFRFVCQTNVQRLRSSEGYTVKVNAEKAVESIKRNSLDDKRFTQKTNSRGSHFFTLQARNGNILAMSRVHTDLAELEADLEIVQSQVGIADLIYE